MQNKVGASAVGARNSFIPTTPLGWFVTIGFCVFAFIVGVELLNVFFTDPYADEPILFTLQGTLAGIPIGWLSRCSARC